MLTIPRSTIRQFQKVLQKAGLLRHVKTATPSCLRLVPNSDGLAIQGLNSQISVSLQISGDFESQVIGLPMTCVSDWSVRSEGHVTVTAHDDKIVASWSDRDVPSERVYEPVDSERLPSEILSPEQWSENSPKFLNALRDAMRVTDTGSMRYALNCIQLAGADGEICSTDSHQALVQKGFAFPWSENLLIPASRIFESSELPRDATVKIGKTDSHVHLQIGPWTIAFAIRTDGHFPDVRRIIPNEAAVQTKLQLDSADAQFLVQRLDQLPVSDEEHRPITVDLNGSVAIRSRQSSETLPTELVLRRSQREGDEVQIAMDRRYLRQAIDFGFTEIGITSKEGPAICRDDRRNFLWAVLDGSVAIPSSEQTHRVDSLAVPETDHFKTPNIGSATPPIATPSIGRHSRAKSRPSPQINSPRHSSHRKPQMAKNEDAVPTEAELIAQLLELRLQLRTIETSIVTIARHLRSRNKRRQLMKATLASLKQLQTLDV